MPISTEPLITVAQQRNRRRRSGGQGSRPIGVTTRAPLDWMTRLASGAFQNVGFNPHSFYEFELCNDDSTGLWLFVMDFVLSLPISMVVNVSVGNPRTKGTIIRGTPLIDGAAPQSGYLQSQLPPGGTGGLPTYGSNALVALEWHREAPFRVIPPGRSIFWSLNTGGAGGGKASLGVIWVMADPRRMP